MTSQVHRVEFNANPIQKQFIESRAKADLFSSRMGEGKSTALAWSALLHTRHNPGASWALIRDTYENMIATTQKTFFQWFPPGVFGTYHATHKVFKWASGIAEGEVQFLGMDDPQDATKLMSRELGGIGIDEPAPAVGSAGIAQEVFDIGLSRLRQPGMKWYGMKLAENNPDEAHWTYKRFVQPGEEGFRVWQPGSPENILHLPPHYYAELRKTFAHRPDLVRRFVEGEFGFQAIGKPVTPQWSDKFHLAVQLAPLPRTDLLLCWDFGLNPTCVITQITPQRHWHVLDAIVGDGLGVEELIADAVKPLLVQKYAAFNCAVRHFGDPNGEMREQSSARRSAVRVLRAELGGTWRGGPVKLSERIEPLRAALMKRVGNFGMIRVDRESAAAIWHALRGGWHHHISRTGVTSGEPVKNIHSHPGDALAYGAACLFPLGRLKSRSNAGALTERGIPGYFTGGMRPDDPFGGRAMTMPKHGEQLRG